MIKVYNRTELIDPTILDKSLPQNDFTKDELNKLYKCINYVDNIIFVELKRALEDSYPRRDENVNNILNSITVAGGCFRRYMENGTTSEADVDLFINNKEDYVNLIDALLRFGYDRAYGFGSEEEEGTRLVNNTFTFDIILKEEQSTSQMINEFDFSVCCLGISKDFIAIHDTYFKDISNKEIVVNNKRDKINSLYRYSKYRNFGYECYTSPNKLDDSLNCMCIFTVNDVRSNKQVMVRPEKVLLEHRKGKHRYGAKLIFSIPELNNRNIFSIKEDIRLLNPFKRLVCGSNSNKILCPTVLLTSWFNRNILVDKFEEFPVGYFYIELEETELANDKLIYNCTISYPSLNFSKYNGATELEDVSLKQILQYGVEMRKYYV